MILVAHVDINRFVSFLEVTPCKTSDGRIRRKGLDCLRDVIFQANRFSWYPATQKLYSVCTHVLTPHLSSSVLPQVNILFFPLLCLKMYEGGDSKIHDHRRRGVARIHGNIDRKMALLVYCCIWDSKQAG